MRRLPEGPNEPAAVDPDLELLPWDRASQAAPAKLVLIPGLGANRLLYGPQHAAEPTLAVPTWIEPAGRAEPLDRYARRLARHVADTLDLAPGFVLGGISLGGMLAAEMAAYLDPSCVAMIGGCRSPRAVNESIRLYARLSFVLPDWFFRLMLLGPVPWVFSRQQNIEGEHRRLVREVAACTEPGFTKWCANAINRWNGTAEADVPCPIRHIHGSDDRIIPADQPGVTELVQGGRHLINLSHAHQVNEFLRSCIKPRTPNPSS